MMSSLNIPFLDLITPHHELREELDSVFSEALSKGAFIGGPVVEDFERAFAEFCGSSHCIGVASGTDALRFALMAAGVNPGEVVVTVPNTFIATTEAISQAGAHPEFVDIDELTCNMDPGKLRDYLEKQCEWRKDRLVSKRSGRPVSAIVPVHLYGQTADMDAILELAEEFNLIVVEDACQAHGAEYFSAKQKQWRKAGTMGRAAAFSFYPGKNLGACGEAGAITTDDAAMAKKMRMLRDHGQAQKYYHDLEGYNGRLDAIQAGILRVKLTRLAEWTRRRRKLAQSYNELLEPLSSEVMTVVEAPRARSVFHLYVIRVRERDQLQKHLAKQLIGTGIHYPVPLHLQKAYAELGYKPGDFPVTERVAAEILSLPMYPQLTLEQQSRVVEKIVEFVATHPAPAFAAKAVTHHARD